MSETPLDDMTADELQVELESQMQVRAEVAREREQKRQAALTRDSLDSLGPLSEAEAQYGESGVCRIEYRDGVIIVRRPAALAWKRYQAQASKEKPEKFIETSQNFFASHTVYPDKERVQGLLDKYPAITNAGIDALQSIARGSRELGE